MTSFDFRAWKSLLCKVAFITEVPLRFMKVLCNTDRTKPNHVTFTYVYSVATFVLFMLFLSAKKNEETNDLMHPTRKTLKSR